MALENKLQYQNSKTDRQKHQTKRPPKKSEQQKLKEIYQQRRAEVQEAKNNLAAMAFFLGQSLYKEGKYREAADSFQEAISLGKTDANVFNWLGMSLCGSAKYKEAEQAFKNALAICEKTPGGKHPYLISVLENYAVLLHKMNCEIEAIKLENRAKTIRGKQARQKE